VSVQVIDAIMARAIQADVARRHPLFGWVVMHGIPECPDAFVARLVTDIPTPYVLMGRSLAEVQAQIPSGLSRFDRQPSDPAMVVEVWFPKDI
jgi:hypothetical protein